MQYELHDFQLINCNNVIEFFNNADKSSRLLVASPTGTGKSIMELYVQSRLRDIWIVTPRFEIIVGMLDKIGVNTKLSKVKLERAALDLRIITPIKFRNLLLAGKIQQRIRGVLWDEGHHHNAETYAEIDCMLRVPSVVYTATPYRGTPKSTKVFRDRWGQVNWAITYPDAYSMGYINIPECTTIPLVDDDLVEIVNGEFVLSAVQSMYQTRLEHIASLIVLDKPTMLSLPGFEMVQHMQRYCEKQHIPYATVTSETDDATRRAAFKACIECRSVLLQINVVSEGVDLPIRRLIDCNPTLSPVKWLQQLGRITRPSEVTAEYICTNRNLQRHAYLLEGCLPLEVILASQTVFPAPERAGIRCMGLEALGRFKPIELPLASGLTGHIYCVSESINSVITNYAAIIHPAMLEPIWAKQIRIRKEFDVATQRWNMEYGDWERITDPPSDLKGFTSMPSGPITDKQKAWWKKPWGAKQFGLNPDVEVTKKNFQALPLLKDLKLRLL